LPSLRDSNIRPFVWGGIALIAALLGLASGLGLASTVLDSGDGEAKARLLDNLSQADDQIQGLQASLGAQAAAAQVLTDALDQAEAQASSALKELEQKKTELKALYSVQSEARSEMEKLRVLKDQVSSLDGFRSLLVEVRKDPPETRTEALSYWSNVKSLAARADASLVSPVDRVILKIDNYFDWDDRVPGPSATIEDQIAWSVDYTTSGAEAYDVAIKSFAKDTLLAVITRIDTVIGFLE
jgi:hypothetical protein